MIPFEEIDISLAMAETGHAVKFPPKRAEELLRVYMAWAEAPEGTVDGGWVQQTQPGHGALWVRIEGRDDLQAVKNKRVKLLEVFDE